MSQKQIVLTREGLKKLEEELETLKSMRPEIAALIKESLAFGDLSENSEYEEAKKEQEDLENRIAMKEFTIKNAKIIDEDDIGTDVVTIGSKVVLQDLDTGEKTEYQIVGSAETDPSGQKISDESPVGSALVGKKKGDEIEIAVPDGVVKFKIMKIYK